MTSSPRQPPRASARSGGSCNAGLYRLLPPLMITEAQVGKIAACFAQALHDTAPARQQQKKSPTLSHFLPLKKLLIKGGVLLRSSIRAI